MFSNDISLLWSEKKDRTAAINILLLRSKAIGNWQLAIGNHSFLSAINGSTFVARRAGT